MSKLFDAFDKTKTNTRQKKKKLTKKGHFNFTVKFFINIKLGKHIVFRVNIFCIKI